MQRCPTNASKRRESSPSLSLDISLWCDGSGIYVGHDLQARHHQQINHVECTASIEQHQRAPTIGVGQKLRVRHAQATAIAHDNVKGSKGTGFVKFSNGANGHGSAFL